MKGDGLNLVLKLEIMRCERAVIEKVGLLGPTFGHIRLVATAGIKPKDSHTPQVSDNHDKAIRSRRGFPGMELGAE